MEYKAIETHYNGYRFRSRLEARWAVFFDHAHIKYEYEPQGFELEDGTRYLPDFYLPEYDYYVEVKPPRENSRDEIEKASKFVGNGINVLVILSNIPKKKKVNLFHYPVLYYNPVQHVIVKTLITIYPDCDGTIYFGAEYHYVRSENKTLYYFLHNIDNELNAINDKDLAKFYETQPYSDYLLQYDKEACEVLTDCYDSARQARFEYGEKG